MGIEMEWKWDTNKHTYVIKGFDLSVLPESESESGHYILLHARRATQSFNRSIAQSLTHSLACPKSLTLLD